MFLWNSLAFSKTQRRLAIWSLVPLPFLNPAWTSGSSQFMYCWSPAWRILSITLLACKMSATMQLFEYSLALPFFGIGMKTDLVQSCGHCRVFQIVGILSTALSQHHLLGFDIGIPSPPLALFTVVSPKAHLIRTPGYLVLGEWSHHWGYLVIKISLV